MSWFRELAVRTTKGFFGARAPTMASSIAYFALATIAPLGVLTLWLSSLLLGPAVARGRVAALFAWLLGKRLGAEMVALVGSQSHKNTHQIAGVIAIVFLLYGAGSLFLALQHALDVIWRVRIAPDTGLGRHIALRATVVFATVFLPCVVLVIGAFARNSVASVVDIAQSGPPPSAAVNLGTQALAILGAWVVVAVLFATLPDGSVGWGSIALGSGFTAVTWSVGTWAFGLYLSKVAIASRFGAAGSLVALLIWIFLIAQLLLYGARLSYEHACLIGKPVEPRPWAESYEKVSSGS